MGPFQLRRVDTAGRSQELLSCCCLILALVAPLPASADDDDAPARSLGPVTVTATRASRSVLEVPGHVTVIDREEIDRSGARTVPELLRRQSGIFVTNTTTNPAGNSLDARGFNNGGGNGGNLLVQVDGRRVNEADLGVPDWALIPLDMIESIEIVRGSTSAIYGDNASAGVINLRTRPIEGPPRATIRGRWGRYDSGGGSLIAAGSTGPVTGSVFISGSDTDGYRANSEFDDRNYNATLEWNFDDRVLVGARGGYHEDFREFPGSLTRFQLDTLGRRAANPNNLDNQSDVERGSIQGWIEAMLADDIELRLRPFFRDLNDDATITASFFGLTTTTLIDADKRGAGIDAQIQVDRPLFGMGNRFIAGFEYLYEKVDRDVEDPFFPNISDNRRDVYSAFLQEELYVTDSVLLAAGVRFDRAELDLDIFRPLAGERSFDSPNYNEWSPKASITWLILPTFSVYSSYARGFRLPTLDEASPLFGSIPDLDAQTSNAGEIGAKYEGDRASGAIALYYMVVDDEILFDPIRFTNQNLDRVRHRGVEASLSIQVLARLTLFGNYTFSDVKILDADDPIIEGARMPITPRHRGTLGLFTELPFDVEFGASANLVGSRHRANDFDAQVAELEFYGTLDLLLAWRPRLGEHVDAAFTLGVQNVTSEKYQGFGTRDDFDPDSGALVPTAFSFPAAKRTWEIGMVFTVRR
ncbi:MAG: TonB-dependent receptor [Myxococcota bacterium]